MKAGIRANRRRLGGSARPAVGAEDNEVSDLLEEFVATSVALRLTEAADRNAAIQGQPRTDAVATGDRSGRIVAGRRNARLTLLCASRQTDGLLNVTTERLILNAIAELAFDQLGEANLHPRAEVFAWSEFRPRVGDCASVRVRFALGIGARRRCHDQA